MTVPTDAPGHPRRLRRRSTTVAAAALTIGLALSGCAAGQNAQTASEYSVQDGVAVNAGQIALRHIGIGAPDDASWTQGSSAPLYLTLVNDGTGDDTLESVTTSVATSVVTGTAGTGSSGSSSSGSESSGSVSSSESGSPTDSGTPTESGSPTDSSTSGSGSVAGSFTPIKVAANSLVTVGGSGSGATTILLAGLKQQLFPAAAVTITFTFADAGSVTVKVPVRLKSDQTGGPTVDISPTGEE